MERKIKQALFLTGAFVSAAVAFMPLTTYAVDPDCKTGEILKDGVCVPYANGGTAVEVKIEDLLSLDAAGSDTVIPAYPNFLRTGNFPVTVRSAVPYTISLSADDTNLTDVADPNHMIPARSNITEGQLGWGIKKDGADVYTAIRQNPQVFFDSGTNVADEAITTNFEVGVAVTDTTAQGTYSTEVTVTAAIKP